MESQVNEITPVLVELKIQFPWERVSSDLNTMYKRVAKTARVKGFRPGKAPTNLVRKLYKREVQADVMGALIEQGLMEAVQKHELQIVAQPKVDAPEIKNGEPLEFVAKCEVRPTIDKVDLDGLSAYKGDTTLDASLIDEEIERLRHQHSELIVPEPMRGAKKGDQLKIDYKVTVDDKPMDDLSADGRQVDLGDGGLLEEFESALMGLSPDENNAFDVDFPQDHQNPELSGKKVHFEVKVVELRERVLPELDDEFAKDCGEYENLKELRDKLSERHQTAMEKRQENELKDQLIEALIEKNKVEVPPAMVQEQKQQLVYELMSLAQMSGGLGGMGQEMLDNLDERAEKRVRASIVLGALARQEDLSVSEEDMEAKLKEISEATGKHLAKVRVDHTGERRDQLETQLLEAKLMTFLKGKAKLLDGVAPEKKKEAAAEATDDVTTDNA